jgi:hypothetical protein
MVHVAVFEQGKKLSGLFFLRGEKDVLFSCIL